MGEDFDYAAEFATLDLDALAKDVDEVLTTSQDWWPADFGHYGPLVIRMVWHCAGTYRVDDGRGGPGAGMQRFAPLNSWPDNRNLDKARRLLWPVKKKYGRRISWADLMVFAGNRALETMGFTTFGFARRPGGRLGARRDVYWGPERAWLGDERHRGVRELEDPLAADQMGLIYVNPEGPNTVPDPLTVGPGHPRDVPAHGDERRGDRRADRRAGTRSARPTARPTRRSYLGPEPEGAPLEEQGLGWKSSYGTGKGADTITSGLEGTWTPTPTRWDNSFLETLFGYEWDVALSPAGLWQWIPRDGGGAGTVPDAHDPSKTHAPTILTTDLALRFDPVYEPISRRFLENPDQLADAFARVWFKLTHLDMGPIQRYLGPLVPQETLLWQDPVPAVDHELVGRRRTSPRSRTQILASGLSVSQLVSTAWASASTFRGSDKRGGANGARIRLEPQRGWEVNDPDTLAQVLRTLEGIQESFNGAQTGDKKISLADLIVLGGCAAVEQAARDRRPRRRGALHPGSHGRDAGADRRGVLRRARAGRGRVPQLPREGHPAAVGAPAGRPGEPADPERARDDRPRRWPARAGRELRRSPRSGVLTSTPGSLTNDFFVNLLDMGTEWTGDVRERTAETFEGRDRATGEVRWTGSRVDLVFGSNSELRAVAEVYASDDAREKFVHDFVAAWDKVMNLDRYDLS